MFKQTKLLVSLILWSIFLIGHYTRGWAQAPLLWKIHDLKRPQPSVVTPGKMEWSAPPSDAVILFDGKDLVQWSDAKGEPSKWKVENGYMEIVKGAGEIRTRQSWGEVQLHIEWAAPLAQHQGQDRGNSGVFFMGMYEVQVLDSYQSLTYADGQAAAIYGQYPPLVNASRPPGEWQSYDIVFCRPRFDGAGQLLQPARMTVLHNGVLVQDNVSLWGPTNWMEFDPYKAHPDKLPLSMQDHGSPVRYRNIWLRELRETAEPGPAPESQEKEIALAPNVLDHYVGRYEVNPNWYFTLTRENEKMFANFYGTRRFELVAYTERKFSMKRTAGDLVFELDAQGRAKSFVFSLGGSQFVAKKVETK